MSGGEACNSSTRARWSSPPDQAGRPSHLTVNRGHGDHRCMAAHLAARLSCVGEGNLASTRNLPAAWRDGEQERVQEAWGGYLEPAPRATSSSERAGANARARYLPHRHQWRSGSVAASQAVGTGSSPVWCSREYSLLLAAVEGGRTFANSCPIPAVTPHHTVNRQPSASAARVCMHGSRTCSHRRRYVAAR